jgi:hypothetical protein
MDMEFYSSFLQHSIPYENASVRNISCYLLWSSLELVIIIIAVVVFHRRSELTEHVA